MNQCLLIKGIAGHNLPFLMAVFIGSLVVAEESEVQEDECVDKEGGGY